MRLTLDRLAGNAVWIFKRLGKNSILLLALSGACTHLRAQINAPTIPDNGPTTSNPLGIPPNASSSGTNENISPMNGSVNLFIPLVSFPQRTGYALYLGYVHHSNNYDFQQTMTDSTTVYSSDGQDFPVDNITYTDSHATYDPPLEINLPRLQASTEYIGDHNYVSAGSIVSVEPMYCVTNFTFTDWSGNKHPFENTATCNSRYADEHVSDYAQKNLTDSSDGSFYQLNTSDLTNITVTAKDGTVYHFTDFVNPYPDPPNEDDQGNNLENYYDSRPTSTVDTNGNTIQILRQFDPSGQPIYNVTDTIGRKITISSSGVAYTDSNGTPQQITLSVAPSSQTTTVNLQMSCHYTGNSQPGSTTLPTVNTDNIFQNIPASTEATITFPAGNGGGSRVYTLQFDPLDRITKIQYPAGGYTRYDYNDTYSIVRTPANVQCSDTLGEIAHKYECRGANGSCDSEDTTTYTATTDINGDPWNASMSIQDPLGQVEKHVFATTTAFRTNPQETDTYTYSASGTLMRTVHNDYPSIAPPGAGEYSYDITFPSMVTTTLNDISPAISTVTTYANPDYTVTLPYSVTVKIDNPTEIDTTGYDGSTLKKVSQMWEPASAFTSNNHILDRLHYSTTTDPVSGNFTTITNGYDTAGNIRSVAASGTANGAATGPFTTSYLRNGYGEIYQITDPKSNTSTIGYTDSWSNPSQTCVPANASAYPTTVTNALGQTTKYTYNACSGTIASLIDPNSAATNYSYDPQGRVTAETVKDSNQVLDSSQSATYEDTAPETLTTQMSLDGQRSVSTEVRFDGMGRNSSSLLTSDDGGADHTDTTYDALWRKQSVSVPYRIGQSGYGYTSYQYDALNRPLYQCQADNSTTPSTTCTPANSYLQWSYSGNVTTSFDETRRQWQRTNDALGRLTKVLEPDPATGTPDLETDYSYDASGNLLRVQQWGGPANSSGERLRTFQYDGVNRLAYACNPEALAHGSGSCPISGTSGPWSLQYSYDADGNVHTTKDGNNVVTTNNYDALNRVTSRTFAGGSNPTPSETFDYDTSSTNGIGRLADEFTGSRTQPYSWKSIPVYDGVGRIMSEKQCAWQNCPTGGENLLYQYDLAGNVTSASNGIASNPITITSAYDTANRLMTMISNYSGNESAPQTFDAGDPDELLAADTPAAYGPFGLLNPGYAKLTSTGVVGINRQLTYDPRMRVASDRYTSPFVNSPATPTAAVITILPVNVNNDNDQSTQVPGPPTAGSGSALASGSEGTYQICQSGGISCRIAYDSGTVSITVGGYTASANYSLGVTLSQVEQSLLTSLNAPSSPVAATLSGNQLGILAHATGAASNLSMSWSGTINEGGCSKGCHTTPDFAIQLSGSALTGGSAGQPQTVYDSGSISVSSGGGTLSVPFGQGSTAESIASSLATALSNANSTDFTTVASGNTVTVTTVAVGSSTDFSATVNVSYDSTNFTTPSFTPAVTSLVPGADPAPGGTLYGYSMTKSDGSTGYDTNGNVLGLNDTVMGQWSATYDHLNRIQTASAQTGLYGGMALAWNIDNFGNRLTQTATGHVPPQNIPGLSFNNAQNQADQFSYDSAGNVYGDGSNTYLYDGQNRLCAIEVGGGTGGALYGYAYDAEGHRVAKGTLSTYSCDFSSNGFTANSVYVLGLAGEQVTELAGTGAWQHTNIFADGKLLATYSPAGVQYDFADWLGTVRARNSSTSSTGIDTCSSLPFGDSLSCTGIDPTEHHFTGKERDTESSQDYFGARYYSSGTGRFLSPDLSDGPTPVPYADFVNPQSLNLYGYVGNNPLSQIDSTGHGSNYYQLSGKTTMRLDTGSADQVNVHVYSANGRFRGTLNPDTKTIDWGKGVQPSKSIADEVQGIMLARGKYDIAAAKKGMSILGGKEGEEGKGKGALGDTTNGALIFSMLIDTVTNALQMEQVNKLEINTGFHLAIDGSVIVTNLDKYADFASSGAQVSFGGGVFTLQSNGTYTDYLGNQLTQDQNGFHIVVPQI